MKYIISVLMLIIMFTFIFYICGDVFANLICRKKQVKRNSEAIKKTRHSRK
ncbi:hypothetical protein [Anaerosalibacter sp. Marseille-P3206]|uniref:hypothetical protein n=1 Tax=Anaerosalibacter sp. Marseille-P3206 TaxID=1871005 RepID=UPI001356707F|nr:hypothetical protein [Anaerosalibacter sp. Marseille-P3206]